MELYLNRDHDYIQQQNGTVAIKVSETQAIILVSNDSKVDKFIITYFLYTSVVSFQKLMLILHHEFSDIGKDFLLEHIDIWLQRRVLLAHKPKEKSKLTLIGDFEDSHYLKRVATGYFRSLTIQSFQLGDYTVAFEHASDLVVVLSRGLDFHLFQEVYRCARTMKQAFMIIFGEGQNGYISPAFFTAGVIEYQELMLAFEEQVPNYVEYLSFIHSKAEKTTQIERTFFSSTHMETLIGIAYPNIQHFLTTQESLLSSYFRIFDFTNGQIMEEK